MANFGIKINRVPLTTIRYADDAVILSYTIDGLQELLNSITRIGKRFRRNINIAKSKYMLFCQTTYNIYHCK